MSSGVEFARYFGQDYAVLPVNEENLVSAAALLFNRAKPGSLKLGDERTLWGIDRKSLDAATGMDDKSVKAYGFQAKWGDPEKGIRDIHISKYPADIPWEDARKLVMLDSEVNVSGGYLFDRLERIDGPEKVRLCADHALYFMEPQALDAAEHVFADFSPEKILPFIFLPFERTCLEWRTHTGTKLCLVMENTTVEFRETGETMPAINMACAAELPDGRESYATAYFVRTLHEGAFQWGEDEATNKRGGYAGFGRKGWVPVITVLIMGLAFLNSPNLHTAQAVDLSRLNKKRLRNGKLGLSDYTVIRPNAETRQWVRDAEAAKQGVGEHWVKAHLHTYLTGPGRHRPIVKLVAPFQRGDPELGSKEPRYHVTAATEEVKL